MDSESNLYILKVIPPILLIHWMDFVIGHQKNFLNNTFSWKDYFLLQLFISLSYYWHICFLHYVWVLGWWRLCVMVSLFPSLVVGTQIEHNKLLKNELHGVRESSGVRENRPPSWGRSCLVPVDKRWGRFKNCFWIRIGKTWYIGDGVQKGK